MDGTLLAATQISIDRDVKIDHFQLLCIAAVSDGQNAEFALWWVFFFFICDPELYSAVILTFNSALIIEILAHQLQNNSSLFILACCVASHS